VDAPSEAKGPKAAITDAMTPITINKINPTINPIIIRMIILKIVPLMAPSSICWLPKKLVTKLPIRVVLTIVIAP